MENEKRLIDANALKWKIGQVRLYVASLRCGKTIISKILESYRNAVFEEIDNAPTVDAVEVVRCKDCKHNVANKEHDPLDITDYTDIVCDYWMNDGNLPDDFCSYGERKDNE